MQLIRPNKKIMEKFKLAGFKREIDPFHETYDIFVSTNTQNEIYFIKFNFINEVVEVIYKDKNTKKLKELNNELVEAIIEMFSSNRHYWGMELFHKALHNEYKTIKIFGQTISGADIYKEIAPDKYKHKFVEFIKKELIKIAKYED